MPTKASDDRIAEVAVPLPVRGTYHYRIPSSIDMSSDVGRRVLVSFGRRKVAAYILGFTEKSESKKLKDALACLDEEPLFNEQHLEFYKQVADDILAPLGEVIRTALPGGLTPASKSHASITERGRDERLTMFGDPTEQEVLRILDDNGRTTFEKIKKQIDQASGEFLRTMEKRGLIVCDKEVAGAGTKAKTERWVELSILGKKTGSHELQDKAPRQAVILQHLADGQKPWAYLKSEGGTDGALRGLQKKGLVNVTLQEVMRSPQHSEVFEQARPVTLTDEQQVAVTALRDGFQKGKPISYLLHGVTGSGKTEVYLRLLETVVNEGKQAIVLVPEIALTPQLLGRFNARFPGKVASLHSRLSPGEKFDEWRRILRGDACVVVGARSAIFAPVENLGAIVIDEEHEDAFKQEDGVLYDARELAKTLSQMHGCPVVAGSATPSVSSYSRTQKGDSHLLSLTRRIHQTAMPEIQTIDLRDEKYIPTGIGRIMSLPLVEGVENALKDNRQAILFLNRRGHSSFAQCTRCGHVPECGNCAISLTYHRNEKLLRCHYCGYSRQMLPSCPKCGGKLETRGVGTQQVEREIRHFFPQARVARMDKDTTRGKNAITTLLARFSRGEQDILVGTQMVAKGHDFPGVDFIGIIDADTGLHLPDYRASERTFQLLTQVAGRAGRGAAQGTVVIQTRDPEHYAIQAALDHDYQAFYKQEISFRESLKYPPSAAMALVRMTHVEEKVLKNCGLKTADMVREALGHAGVGVGDWAVLGPAPAPFARLRGKFRYNLILRAATRDVLHEFLRGIEKELRKLATEMGVSESIDLYPASFL